MEFLVRIEVRWPADGDPARKAELAEKEAARSRELAAAGTLKRLWRIPGRWANYGLWDAPDATALHAAITSLPFFPWLDVEVTPARRTSVRSIRHVPALIAAGQEHERLTQRKAPTYSLVKRLTARYAVHRDINEAGSARASQTSNQGGIHGTA